MTCRVKSSVTGWLTRLHGLASPTVLRCFPLCLARRCSSQSPIGSGRRERLGPHGFRAPLYLVHPSISLAHRTSCSGRWRPLRRVAGWLHHLGALSQLLSLRRCILREGVPSHQDAGGKDQRACRDHVQVPFSVVVQARRATATMTPSVRRASTLVVLELDLASSRTAKVPGPLPVRIGRSTCSHSSFGRRWCCSRRLSQEMKTSGTARVGNTTEKTIGPNADPRSGWRDDHAYSGWPHPSHPPMFARSLI